MVIEWGWYLAALLVLVLLVFSLGRRIGIRQGRKVGMAEASLAIREDALRSGHCAICARAGSCTKR